MTATTEPDTGLSLKDQNLRAVLFNVLAGLVKAAADDARADHTMNLVDWYDETGNKSFDVKLPDGTKVAGISLSTHKAVTEVSDEDALIAWCEANGHAWLVNEHVTPAVPEHTVTVPATPEVRTKRLDRELLTSFLADVEPVSGSEAGAVVEPEHQQIVDGVIHTPESKPYSYSVRPTTAGKTRLLRAWQLGQLDHLTDGSVLPALGVGQ